MTFCRIARPRLAVVIEKITTCRSMYTALNRTATVLRCATEYSTRGIEIVHRASRSKFSKDTTMPSKSEEPKGNGRKR